MESNYEQLVEALRCKALSKQCDSCKYGYHLCPDSECNDACHVERIIDDAADAIEALQAEVERLEPQHGEWILCGPVGWPNWRCSVCHSEGRGDYIRCPWCGAVLDESNASNTLNALDNAQDGPIITPCRGCSDYDGYGGCKSKGGCARAKMEVQDDKTGV